MTDLVFFPASSRPEERQGVAVRVSDLRRYLAAKRSRDPEVGFVFAHSCVGTLPHTGDGAPVRILSESAAATLAPVPYAVRLGFAEDALRVAGPAWFGERYVSRAAVDRALAALEPAAEAARAPRSTRLEMR